MLTLALAVFLMLNLGAGMWRVPHGPTAADRMLAAHLFGTTAVAVLLLLAERRCQRITARCGAGVRPAVRGNSRAVRAPRPRCGVLGDGRDRLRADHSEAQAVRRAAYTGLLHGGRGAGRAVSEQASSCLESGRDHSAISAGAGYHTAPPDR